MYFSQRQLFLNHVAQTSKNPLMGFDINIEKAYQSWLYDVSGKKYFDLISGISVSSIGHCHKKVVEAVDAQSKKFMHLMVYGEFNQAPQVNYALELTEKLTKNLNSVYYTTGGSEGIELAMKLSKRATGRSEIIGFKNSYHGSTQGALSLMGNEMFKQAYRPLLPNISHLTFNSISDLNNITSATAAVFIELIQGEAGVIAADKEFVALLRNKCDETGCLLIVDEIQTGFARTGSLFAFEQYNISPDVLIIAKGMGGGLPIGAVIASKKLMGCFTENPILGHINTFGGNAVCVEAARATLKVIIDENLTEKAKQIEVLIKKTLRHRIIKSLRVYGAIGAIDFESEELNFKIISECIKNEIITDWFLFCSTAMRIAPPLTSNLTELEVQLKKILKIFDLF
ncbi:MAG: aspartate aminotransferase family protein [Bacteroidetes bacterium]|nr:aspartate aminotransferase family protein [Bacteroidota bacterium]